MNSAKLNEEELNARLIELQKCIELSDQLSKNFDQILLLRYLKFFNGNVQRALNRLTKTTELRSYYSNIFFKRDTLDPRLRRLIDQIEMFLMPQLTADNHRIMIFRLIDCDPDSIIFEDALSVFSLVYDTTLIMPEKIENNQLADGEILIFDLNGLTSKHLWRLGFSPLRCFFRYMLEAHPMRIKEVHLINCSAMLDKLVLLIRPFITSDTMKVVHFHLPNSTTLFDYIPRELLPNELSGSGGSVDIPKWYWIRKTEDHREYHLDDERWTIKDKSVDNNNLTNDDALRYLGFC